MKISKELMNSIEWEEKHNYQIRYMAKAYNRVNWNFFRKTMGAFGFNKK